MFDAFPGIFVADGIPFFAGERPMQPGNDLRRRHVADLDLKPRWDVGMVKKWPRGRMSIFSILTI